MRSILTVVSAALQMMGPSPGPFARALEFAADYHDEPVVSLADLIAHLRAAPADDAVRLRLHQQLSRWDAEAAPSWAAETRHQSSERRQCIYDRIDATIELRAALDLHFPPHIVTDPGFDITRPFKRWFDPHEQEELGFYWPRYRELLLNVERWPAPNVESLARATAQIVERLGDPHAGDDQRHLARGLVVGYVQSGKTANFTGVIARAVDAGYRLIIVLTGMTTTLRRQTQRRLDKQLIGQELLRGGAAGEFEYPGAPDWDRFISYGAPPSQLGSVGWRRLTTFGRDYRRLQAGIGTLHFELADRSLPLNHPTNLRATAVRLVVAMKHQTPLTSLVADLKQVSAAGYDVAHLPALIIDDESDQASVNTRRPPSSKELRSRTTINAAITDLLALLPRGQYVGYTATPFANVFIDPSDGTGIFPRDFITGLDRPAGYMGAADYHDIEPTPLGRPSNEKCYVRDVRSADAEELPAALDAFLLSGALKLFRADAGAAVSTKHHTMLVHTSSRKRDHEETRLLLEQLLEEGGYSTGGALSRLERLFIDDFREISCALAPSLPFPKTFDALRPQLTQCYSRLCTGRPVLIVNGEREHEAETPDFDMDSVWKVIVGGTKLSRGYTVEGLTVSYYRRATRAADTLMQMGRWFGFREGYRDLMRLYIGRAEKLTARKTIDLYEAFEAICRDELDFRAELTRYALPEDGSVPIRPMDVAPRVRQRFPDLTPTAKNKMFNARLVSENFGGRPVTPTLAPVKQADVEWNLRLTTDAFPTGMERKVLGVVGDSFDADLAIFTPESMIHFLERYRFSVAGLMDRLIAFLRGDLGDPGIGRWAVVWPRLSGADTRTWRINGTDEATVIHRYRAESGRFNVYTTPTHVRAATAIAGLSLEPGATDDTRALAIPGTGSALFYAVQERGDDEIHIGFALYVPKNGLKGKTVWSVVDPTHPDEPVIDAPGDGQTP